MVKGKSYINESLEFEGEYFYHNKWDGKGYDEFGKITYELHNGKGKVKEYYYNVKLRFEGKYINGRRNGEGKEYNGKGKLIFEGQYLNGKINGKGKDFDGNGKLNFECNYFNGEKIGEGEKKI